MRSTRARPMRIAHSRLLPHIDFAGIRLRDLADRSGLAKQTVGPLIAELEEAGLVAVEEDPHDRRAKRVRYTSRGVEALQEGLEVLAQSVVELETKVGERAVRQLGSTLRRWIELLESPEPPGV